MGAMLQALLLEIPERLETARLALAATRAGLGEAVNQAVVESHAALKPWMPWAQHVPTIEESETHCREAQAKWHAREMLDFCFLSRTDGRLVGKGGLHTIDWAIPKFEIGYWIRTSCARQGYAAEAVNALAEFAREKLNACRLEITSDARNGPSRGVAEKCGFVLEGVLRQSRRDVEGALADACMYARIF
ncbi:MAG TPA: GNAT family protein [Usitatibacter sp.]|nr:GNAT family protein [Usitatibacter sp.]